MVVWEPALDFDHSSEANKKKQSWLNGGLHSIPAQLPLDATSKAIQTAGSLSVTSGNSASRKRAYTFHCTVISLECPMLSQNSQIHTRSLSLYLTTVSAGCGKIGSLIGNSDGGS